MIEKHKSSGFIKGAAIIAAAHILVKIIGAIYKIPLDRVFLKTDGMALYFSSYNIYNLLFVISTAGLPVAISKLVAEAISKNDYEGANRIFKISFGLLFTVGTIGTLMLSFGAKIFAGLVNFPDAWLTMLVMSPSLLFVACMSAFRGYFQGQQNMFPTAISEVLEASGKLLVGLSLAGFLISYGKPIASAGAIAGVTTGSLAGLIFLFFYYNKNKIKTPKGTMPLERKRTVLKRIVLIAVPITIGVSVFTLTSLIDTAMISRQMSRYIDSPVMTQSVKEHLEEKHFQEYIKKEDPQKKVEYVFGYLTRAITLFNLPPTIIAAIAVSVVPAIAAAKAKKDKKRAKDYTSSALRLTSLLGLPCAIGMSVLASPILSLVYGDSSYSSLLMITAISISLVTFVQIGNAALQAWDNVWIPVINMLIGGFVKVGVNLLLVGNSAININGAPIGTLLCYLTVVTLNMIALKRVAGLKFEMVALVIKPVVCALVMGAAAMFFYKTIYSVLGAGMLKMAVALGLSIGFAGIIYLIMIITLRAVKKEDILLLPKGEMLAQKLHNFI